MNNKRKLLIIIVIIVFVLAGGYLLYGSLSDKSGGPESGPTQGTLGAAPEFTVYDEEGNAVSLSDYSGKPVVINFWASWCGPCKEELPHFQGAYEEYDDRVQFLMVNLTGGGTDTKENSSVVINENGYTFPVFYDDDSSGAEAYDISSIPVTCFINSEGELVNKSIGSLSEEKLLERIAEILSEE